MRTPEIEIIKQHFVKKLLPVQIYLFGSYANDTYTANSDLDFYIIVPDDVADLAAETTKAYQAIRKVKNKPVDILLGTKSHFELRKDLPTIENEVFRSGVLLYDAGNEKLV